MQTTNTKDVSYKIGDNPNEFYQNGTLPVQNASTNTKQELLIWIRSIASKMFPQTYKPEYSMGEVENLLIAVGEEHKKLLSQAHQSGIEEERERIFNATSRLRLSYGKDESRPEYKLVNDTIKEIWVILGAKQNERGDFELLESLKENKQ